MTDAPVEALLLELDLLQRAIAMQDPYGELAIRCQNALGSAASIAAWNRRAEPVSVQEVGSPDMESMTQQAARDARDVFSGNKQACEAVDYMEQLIYAALRALAADKKE